jgi:hypothetical protein
VIITGLLTIQAGGGLLIDGLYRDNLLIRSAWRGNDLVTLVVAVPLLVGALAASRRGSQRGQLLWLAMLAYTLYGSAFYLFGAAFNRFFLIYVALCALSIQALIAALPRIDIEAIRRGFSARTPTKWISAYLLLIAVGVGGVWTAMSLSFVATGRVPQPVAASEHPTAIVFALDLTLLVPFLVLAAVWLWRRRAWGYVLASMMCAKGATYTLALTVSSLFADRAGIAGVSAEIVLWAALTTTGAAATAIMFGSLRGRGGQ